MSVKIIKGWDGSLEIGRNDSGYYSFDEILYFFNIGPAKLKFYLEEYKDIIVPIYNNNDNDILNSRYHWLEVKELNRIITKKHKNERYWEKILIHSDNSTDKYQECDAMQARISELETELAACREQLEKDRVENPSPNTKTSTATQVRQKKSLADWKDAFKVMVPVILQCQKDGPKPRTTPELEKMCARYNGTLDKSKMAFLRECLKECLGPEHVNTTGGPTIQG